MSPARVAAATRLGLKKLLKHSQHKPAPDLPPTPAAPIERLPAHIVRAITRDLQPWDVLQWGLCSSKLRTLLAPALYSTVELNTNRQCKTALITFSKHPEITQHIRRLVVHVNPVEWTGPDEELDEDLVANLITKLAAHLEGLEAFEWDGLEMPHDDLWLALKNGCRNLKRIGTTIGYDPLSVSSPLWDFDDLRQISLTVKCHSLDWLSEGLPKTEKLPRRFWAMLIERCPRLEELTIGGAAPSPRMFDIRHVMIGRWPRLRRITLGDMVLVSPAKGEEQVKKDHAAFMAFFAAHPTLRGIHFQHPGGNSHFPAGFTLPPDALANVTSFSGPLRLLKTLPNLHLLRDLTLTKLHHASSSFSSTFAVLQDLNNLESLNIWIDLSFGAHGSLLASSRSSGENMRGSPPSEDIQILCSLATSAQNLKHLDISCFTRPTFYIRDFSRILQTMPSLESFSLTKVYKSNEEDLARSAARIVAENRHIRRFMLRMTCDAWFSSMRGRVKHQGTYEVLGPSAALYAPSSPTSPTSCSPAPEAAPTPGPASQMALSEGALLLAHECGLRSITGKDYVRRAVHAVAPPPREAPPPSAFGRHRLSLSRSLSRARAAEGAASPPASAPASDCGHGTAGARAGGRTHSRTSSLSLSISGSLFARAARRRSASCVAPGAGGADVASARSSISSAASHASVAWAERDMRAGALGRSGSGSSASASGASAAPAGPDAHLAAMVGEEEEDYVLV